MNISIGVATGTGRTECEDSAFINDTIVSGSSQEHSNVKFRCIGVADGVGGNEGGKIASRYIATRIGHEDFSIMSGETIHRFLAELNAELIQYASSISGKQEMATTLTALVAAADGLYVIHAGNTRLYVMQGSYLKQITSDHTTYNWLMDRGQYEAAEQCKKNEINCCLGGGHTKYAAYLVVQKVFDEGLPDTLLFTSDGIHDYIDIDDMEDILNSKVSDIEKINQLAAKAAENGSSDDKAIIIFRSGNYGIAV